MQHRKKQFLLISVIPSIISDNVILKDLVELKHLVETYGGEVADLVTQRREAHDKGGYIGKGKITEAEHIIALRRINVVVLNGIVKPGQLYEIKKILAKSSPGIEVWDRIDLILKIFSQHAHTIEARLQIELAAMRHMGPRIYGMGMELSRQSGGIGTRGIGETNTERMKRHWREQTKKVRDTLEELEKKHQQQLEHRKRLGLATVSVVGYTNAGKTSLFNTLTKKEKITANALFVTLDSTVGKVYLPTSGREILISDTIGFIKNLPTGLIDAFTSTLMESIHADILLHVIDASDEDINTKVLVVQDILFDLGLENKKKILVFNKIDAIDNTNKVKIMEQYHNLPMAFVSAKTGQGVEELLHIIEKHF